MSEKTHLGQCLPQVCLPVIKRLEEAITRRIAFPDVDQPLCSSFNQETINKLGDALVRIHPVGIAAPKQPKLDALRLTPVHALDPLDEVGGVVRRLAFKRGGDNYDGLVCWEVADGIIEGRDSRFEAWMEHSTCRKYQSEIPVTYLSPKQHWRSAARRPPSSPYYSHIVHATAPSLRPCPDLE